MPPYGSCRNGPAYEFLMANITRLRVRYVIAPDGSPLTINDLPPPDTKRWVIRRKAEVVAAVRGGLLSLDEACARYGLSVEEFLSWQMSIDRGGRLGTCMRAHTEDGLWRQLLPARSGQSFFSS